MTQPHTITPTDNRLPFYISNRACRLTTDQITELLHTGCELRHLDAPNLRLDFVLCLMRHYPARFWVEHENELYAVISKETN